MRWFYIMIAFSLLTTMIVNGQISRGGKPLAVPGLKSRGISEKVMPAIDNDELLLQSLQRTKGGINLKSFRFAHAFKVHFSPLNEGIWTNNINGYAVWRLKIRSREAKSINLIFGKFNLPKQADLFIYNEKEGFYLGAYTSYNNKKSGKFAISPVPGEEIVIQYEVPSGSNRTEDFIISRVNHDFAGILKYNNRRPSGILPGDCNIDINCSIGQNWKDVKDAVCRFISGTDICTGTLVNNTEENQKPYIISAAHCFQNPEDAETSVFTFNYESPYCAALEGDPSNSISGALMRASSDSLDFALVELSLAPPPEFRPYYAGWDKSGNIPDSAISIHQPQGHIKKISIDRDSPRIADYRSEYTKNGFLKIVLWDIGVTEPGSSGGPLFSPDQNLIGTLTGGEATCANPVNDYFSRFSVAWEYKTDSSKQLKVWLDPLDSDVDKLNGKRFYTSENLCLTYTNLNDEDEHDNIKITNTENFAGYWGGTNNLGITGFAEKYAIPGDELLHGLSIGIGKIDLFGNNGKREIEIKVYNGNLLPEEIIYTQNIEINNLVPDAMNFIEFDETVEPADTFFVGFDLININPKDTFVVYQSLRPKEKENLFYFRQDGLWYDFQNANSGNYSMANIFELVACNVDRIETDTSIVTEPLEAIIYPNPAGSIFTFEAGQTIDSDNIKIFNLIGKEIVAKYINARDKKVQIDLSGNIPGIYFVRLSTQKGTITRKVSYIPW